MPVIQRGKRAQWPGATGPSVYPRGPAATGGVPASAHEQEAAARWLDNRDAGHAATWSLRIARAIWNRGNHFDAPVLYPWSALRRGTSPVQQLHQFVAQKKREDGGRGLGRLWLWTKACLWPLLACAAIGPLLVRCGWRVRDRHGVPLRAQVRALISATWRFGLFPTEYYHHRIFRMSPDRDHASYVNERAQHVLLRESSRDLEVGRVNDLACFLRECRAAGLPTVRTVAAFAPDDADSGAERAVGELPARDLFLRPVSWVGQTSGELWRWNAQTRGWMYRGEAMAASQLWGRASRRADRHPWILQESISNHPDIARFSAGGVCVARLATAIGGDGEPRVLFAALHLPASVDGGWGPASGELVAGVDVASGRLGVAMDEFVSGGEFSVHPATGQTIEDAVIPQWLAMQDLAIRAHRHFSALPFVGWRMALSGGGPLLLDANTDWGMFRHVWPADTAFTDLCRQRLAALKRGGPA